MSYDHVTVTVTCNITLIPNSKFQNKRIKEKEIEIRMRKKLKIIRVYHL